MTTGLYSAVSGIRAEQTAIDVISNNISNINTSGFKSSGANFATVYANTITGGGAPTGTLGGTNPMQVGTGTLVSDISQNFGQGGTEYTGKNTDAMINGNGFFAIEHPNASIGLNQVASDYYLTRAGNFSLDSQGNLVTSQGDRIRGTSQLNGSNPQTLSTIKIPQQLIIVKDLDSAGDIKATHLAPTGTSTATINAAMSSSATTQSITSVQLNTFSIGSDGAITATYSNGDRITVRTDANTVSATDPTQARREIVLLPAEGGTFGPDNDGLGHSSQTSDTGLVNQINGGPFTAPPGGNPLQGMQLQLQTASVINPNGLLASGDNTYTIGANSGQTNFGIPGSGSLGSVQGGALESSNVDLASQFTSLTSAQRGLEADSKIIKAQSDILQTIINIVQ